MMIVNYDQCMVSWLVSNVVYDLIMTPITVVEVDMFPWLKFTGWTKPLKFQPTKNYIFQ